MRDVVILVLAAALVFALWRLGDVERQRYAMALGMCPQDVVGFYDFGCMDKVEPRTSRLWDIAYGLLP